MRDCIKRIVEQSGLTEPQARKMAKDVDQKAKRRSKETGQSYEDAVDEVVAENLQTIKENAEIIKRNYARNVILKKKNETFIQDMLDNKEFNPSITLAFQAMFEGINTPLPGGKNSLEVNKHAVRATYLNEIVGNLSKEGLLNLFSDGKLSSEIGRAVWDLTYDQPPKGGNKQANRIAQIIYDVREKQRLRLIKLGADIQKLPGYVMPQRPDLVAMRKMGKPNFIEFMRSRLDKDRSFGGDYEDLDKALSNGYDAQLSGVRLDGVYKAEKEDEKFFQFFGPNNLAKKLSQRRQYIFKDYESWEEWNNTLGMRSFHEGVIDSITYNADNIALMERFGTNPEAMMKEVYRSIKEKNRDIVDARAGDDDKIEQLITGAMEKQRIPANATLATVSSNIRAYNIVTMLGKAIASYIGDVPIKAFEYRNQGKNWLSALTKSVVDIGYGFKNKQDRIEFASMSGVYFESVIGNIGRNFSLSDDINGFASKAVRLFFRLNLQAWWTDVHQGGFVHTMSHWLGLKAGLEFDALDADTARFFSQYDITKKDWDTMRAAVTTLEDGRAYVLADKISDQAVAEKLSGYFFDRRESAVLNPGARERRILTFGNTKRGTPRGEFFRLAAQYKSYPVSVITKVLGQAWYGRGKPDIGGLITLLLLTSAFGYLSGVMSDLFNGKSPKDPLKTETILASIARGGGAGILTDVFLTDFSSYGKDFSSFLLGPTFGNDKAIKLWSSLIRGEGSTRAAAMMAISSIPGNNLFYIRGPLDHLFLLEMQEQMNPGFMNRAERDMRKTFNQEWLWK
jgi:hypothetical protein